MKLLLIALLATLSLSSAFACKDTVECSDAYGRRIIGCMGMPDTFVAIDKKTIRSVKPIKDTKVAMESRSFCESNEDTFIQKFDVNMQLNGQKISYSSMFICQEMLACE
jgi:hypothetical protein